MSGVDLQLYQRQSMMMAADATEDMHVPTDPANVATAVVVDRILTEGSISDAPVPWWSFGKTVLAAAALKLVDSGRLSLDALLPGRRYTLRQLLQHRTGLPDYGWPKSYHEAVARGDEPWSVTELLERVSALRPGQPGGAFSYSNVGYLFVRQLIEDAAGEAIDAAVARLVLAPLGVTGVKFARLPEHLNGTRWGNARRYHPGWVYQGLMIGPPAAAALLLDRLMRGECLSFQSSRAMQESLPIGPAAEGSSGRLWNAPSYGLGLMIERAGTTTLFAGHTGQGPGSTAAVYHFPDPVRRTTTAVFAPVMDEAMVERRAIALARDIQR